MAPGSSRRRRQRPPRRQCLACGTIFYGYTDACLRCWRERAEDRSALVSVVKQNRQLRLDEREFGAGVPSESPAAAGAPPVPYNQFPEGF